MIASSKTMIFQYAWMCLFVLVVPGGFHDNAFYRKQHEHQNLIIKNKMNIVFEWLPKADCSQ